MFKSLLALISILTFSSTLFPHLILAQYDPYPDIPACVVSPLVPAPLPFISLLALALKQPIRNFFN